MKSKEQILKELTVIPGIGKSMAIDLWDLGIRQVSDLAGKNAESMYETLCKLTGLRQDRCVLYVFRCAIYFAETPDDKRNPEKLKWWNWKDN